jgi:hypothetical protein
MRYSKVTSKVSYVFAQKRGVLSLLQNWLLAFIRRKLSSRLTRQRGSHQASSSAPITPGFSVFTFISQAG